MPEEKNVMRLAKPLHKGIWRLVFSRFFVILLLVLLQVGLAAALFRWLRLYWSYYSILQALFSLGMILYLFNNRMDSSAKLSWLMLIAVAPFAGAFFLFYTRTNLGQRAIRSRALELIDSTKRLLPQDPATARRARDADEGLDALHTFLNRNGCFPVYGDSSVRYFPGGEAFLEVLLEALERAERYIYMEFFIIEEGCMWGSVLDILARKAAQGIDVRVLYDGMCEISNLPPDYAERLTAVGIRAKAFSRIRPLLSTHYNYRDHRKIVVIDGKTAFTGGVNLADEYINRKKRFGHWKDAAIALHGGAAQSYALMFLQMWNITESEADFSALSPAEPAGAGEGEGGYVLPFADNPLDGVKVGETVYMDILYRAVRYVHIMTPYLILDGELEAALKYAAERGVDVKLILPGLPDKRAAYALAKSHYPSLIRSGVKIYEYTPGFIHSKVFVSDGERAVVGTINLDYRSLYHHFECAAYLCKTPCIPSIEADFDATLPLCRRVTPESMKREKLFYKLLGPLLKLVAPLM